MTLSEFEEKMNQIEYYVEAGLYICGSILVHLGGRAAEDFRQVMTPTIEEACLYNNNISCFWGAPKGMKSVRGRHTRHELLLMWEQHVLKNKLYLRWKSC